MDSPSVCKVEDQRLLVAANTVALATLVPVVLHQLGVVRHLPDPPATLFDSDRITESKMAHPLGVPDGLLGVASYGTTLLLALMAGRSKCARKMLGTKLLLDGGVAAFNATRQVVRFGKLCSWCMGTVVATGAMVYAGRSIICEVFSNEIAKDNG